MCYVLVKPCNKSISDFCGVSSLQEPPASHGSIADPCNTTAPVPEQGLFIIMLNPESMAESYCVRRS